MALTAAAISPMAYDLITLTQIMFLTRLFTVFFENLESKRQLQDTLNASSNTINCKWIYERSYIWTAEKDMIYDWSSQLHTQPKSWELVKFVSSQIDQLPDGLIAQSVEHCNGIAEVMGSNPVQAWIFFRL